VIGDHGQDGIDLAFADERFQTAGVEPMGVVVVGGNEQSDTFYGA